jgi:hypothetical protein
MVIGGIVAVTTVAGMVYGYAGCIIISEYYDINFVN